MQVHLVQLSTTQVSFSAKNRPSCQHADMFLVFGGPPMSSQSTWLSLDWKSGGFRDRQEHSVAVLPVKGRPSPQLRGPRGPGVQSDVHPWRKQVCEPRNTQAAHTRGLAKPTPHGCPFT